MCFFRILKALNLIAISLKNGLIPGCNVDARFLDLKVELGGIICEPGSKKNAAAKKRVGGLQFSRALGGFCSNTL